MIGKVGIQEGGRVHEREGGRTRRMGARAAPAAAIAPAPAGAPGQRWRQ